MIRYWRTDPDVIALAVLIVMLALLQPSVIPTNRLIFGSGPAAIERVERQASRLGTGIRKLAAAWRLAASCVESATN